MISDLYIRDIHVSNDISSLGSDMNCYWGSFAQLLNLEEEGEKIDHNSRCYQESFKYSNSIPEKADLIKKKISKISCEIMNKEDYATDVISVIEP